MDIESEENIENVSGVMAYVTSLFAEYNINIIELISCFRIRRNPFLQRTFAFLSVLIWQEKNLYNSN